MLQSRVSLARALTYQFMVIALACVTTFTTREASAQLTGSFTTTGNVGISASRIDFGANGVGPGAFTIGAGPTGSFSLFAGFTGLTADVNLTTHSVNTAFSDLNFMTFSTVPTLAFDATLLAAGGFSSTLCGAVAAAGQQCTPANSPFAFTNTSSTASTFSFGISGIAHDGVNSGAFTAIFTGAAPFSFQNFLTTINAGGTVTSSYTGSFQVVGTTSTVPEPSTLALLVAGLAAVVVVRRKRTVPR